MTLDQDSVAAKVLHDMIRTQSWFGLLDRIQAVREFGAAPALRVFDGRIDQLQGVSREACAQARLSQLVKSET